MTHWRVNSQQLSSLAESSGQRNTQPSAWPGDLAVAAVRYDRATTTGPIPPAHDDAPRCKTIAIAIHTGFHATPRQKVLSAKELYTHTTRCVQFVDTSSIPSVVAVPRSFQGVSGAYCCHSSHSVVVWSLEIHGRSPSTSSTWKPGITHHQRPRTDRSWR